MVPNKRYWFTFSASFYFPGQNHSLARNPILKRYIIIWAFLLSVWSYQARAQSTSPTSGEMPPKLSHLPVTHPPVIELKDIASDTGKYIELREAVYNHTKAPYGPKLADTVELLALGAAYPNEKLTILVMDKAFQAFKSIPIDGQIVKVDGYIVLYKGEYQLYVRNPADIITLKSKDEVP